MDEELKEKLLKQAKNDNRQFKGYSPVGVEIKGTARPGLQKLGRAASQGLAMRNPVTPTGVGEFDKKIEPKRTEMQRVESLANRLWGAVADRNPGETERILKMMQAEGWKSGSPISYEEVKRIAITQMKLAAAKAKEDGR